MKTKYFNMEWKEVETKDDGTIVINGFASTPDIDRYDDIVKPKAFAETMETYMKNPIILLQHDSNRPIGKVTDYGITWKGLKVTVEISEDTDGVKGQIQKGILGAFSIGFIPLAWKMIDQNGKPIEDGQIVDYTAGEKVIREITKLDLIEISVVSTPANANAVFSLAKSVKSFFNDDDFKHIITNQHNMEVFAKMVASLEAKESITSEEKSLLTIAFESMDTDSQAEKKEVFDQIVAKEVEAEESETPTWDGGGDEAEAPAEAEAEAEADEAEAPSEGSSETDEKAVIAELKADIEAKNTRLDEMDAKFAEMSDRMDGITSRKTTVQSASGEITPSNVVAFPELNS